MGRSTPKRNKDDGCAICRSPISHEVHHIFGRDHDFTMPLCLTCHDLVTPERVRLKDLLEYMDEQELIEPLPVWAKRLMYRLFILIMWANEKANVVDEEVSDELEPQ